MSCTMSISLLAKCKFDFLIVHLEHDAQLHLFALVVYENMYLISDISVIYCELMSELMRNVFYVSNADM